MIVIRSAVRLFSFYHLSYFTSVNLSALFSSFISYFSGLTENDGHEIGGQDIYRLKIDYITMHCAILFKTTAEYKSSQRSKLYRPTVFVE